MTISSGQNSQLFGISGKLLCYTKYFLVNGTQHVAIGGIHLRAANVTSDVPSGTVLNPLLSIVSSIIKDSKMEIFADDFKPQKIIKEKDQIELQLGLITFG